MHGKDREGEREREREIKWKTAIFGGEAEKTRESNLEPSNRAQTIFFCLTTQ